LIPTADGELLRIGSAQEINIAAAIKAIGRLAIPHTTYLELEIDSKARCRTRLQYK
jgi:hypothetical protein